MIKKHFLNLFFSVGAGAAIIRISVVGHLDGGSDWYINSSSRSVNIIEISARSLDSCFNTFCPFLNLQLIGFVYVSLKGDFAQYFEQFKCLVFNLLNLSFCPGLQFVSPKWYSVFLCCNQ